MSKEQLNQKEQHYAGSRDEAEEIVSSAKKNIYLTMHKISEKHNKFGTYFLVDLTYSYNLPKEIMESAAAKNAEKTMHEGVKVTQDSDGQFHVDPNQISIDDVEDVSEESESDNLPF